MNRTILVKSKIKWVFIFVVLLAAVFPVGHALAGTVPMDNVQAGTPVSGDDNDKTYVIGPTNLLHIKVLGEAGLQQTFRVDESGYITFPLIGRVQVGGKNVAQAEKSLTEALRGDYILNPSVSIFILEHSHFSVLGEVRKPGSYELLGRLSMAEAISMAGGFTPVSNEKSVKVLRRTPTGDKTLNVNVRDIIDGKKNDDESYVQAGDIIDVPKSFF